MLVSGYANKLCAISITPRVWCHCINVDDVKGFDTDDISRIFSIRRGSILFPVSGIKGRSEIYSVAVMFQHI